MCVDEDHSGMAQGAAWGRGWAGASWPYPFFSGSFNSSMAHNQLSGNWLLEMMSSSGIMSSSMSPEGVRAGFRAAQPPTLSPHVVPGAQGLLAGETHPEPCHGSSWAQAQLPLGSPSSIKEKIKNSLLQMCCCQDKYSLAFLRFSKK